MIRGVVCGCLQWLGGLTLAADPAQAPPLPKDTLPKSLDVQAIPANFRGVRPVPQDNPLSSAKVRLGRRLFFDPVLSADRGVACASCHDPRHGFATEHSVAIGIGGVRGARNAPSLFNVAYGRAFFWDGRAVTLEVQALEPIESPRELGSKLATVLERLRGERSYVEEFRAAFDDGVTAANLAKAIASFERTLLLGDSQVDRFRAGDVTALSIAERQGLWLFESRGGCWRCHTGPNFTDGEFHNSGVGWGKTPPDLGRFGVTRRDADRGRFKTPSLRGVGLTDPYMHDGSLKTLEAVVRFYGQGGNRNPYLDPAIQPVKFTEVDVKHLVAFLQALTGQRVWERSAEDRQPPTP